MTEHKRRNIINSIMNKLEDHQYSEWENGFLEDIIKQLQSGKDLSVKQLDKLTDIIGYDYLK
jgi:trehalose-6-phosphate synthase